MTLPRSTTTPRIEALALVGASEVNMSWGPLSACALSVAISTFAAVAVMSVPSVLLPR
jgi:hypothetical protein